MKLVKSILLVCFALLLTCGFYAALSYFECRPKQNADIKVIAQTGPLKEGLKTQCLEELLNLSCDKPSSITAAQAKKRLLKTSFIKEAEVSFLNPETLYIDYTLRVPVFILGDYENLSMDEEKEVFPLSPYYTPKNLPTLYLGVGQKKEKENVAFHLLSMLEDDIKFIDVSKWGEERLGKREIVLGIGKHLLRLNTKTYEKELVQYGKIREKIQDEEVIIDLRIQDLAYISRQKTDSPFVDVSPKSLKFLYEEL